MNFLGGFYDDTFKYPKKYKIKLVSLFIIIIGQILNFYTYTQIFIVKYGLISRLLVLILSIFLLVLYQKEYFKNSKKKKVYKYFVIVSSSIIWLPLFFFSLDGFYERIVLNSYYEKKHSSKVIVKEKYIGTNHKTTYNLITTNHMLIKTTEKIYKNVKKGDTLDFFFFSKKDIYYYKKKNPVKIPRLLWLNQIKFHFFSKNVI